MGRVDLMDHLISYYSMTFRTKRWLTRVILHLLSMSVVNSWIKYRERELKKGVSRKLVIDLLSFREELADSLCKSKLAQHVSEVDRVWEAYSNTLLFHGRKHQHLFHRLLRFDPMVLVTDPKRCYWNLLKDVDLSTVEKVGGYGVRSAMCTCVWQVIEIAFMLSTQISDALWTIRCCR